MPCYSMEMKYAPFEQLELTLKPNRVIRTTMRTKFDSPHQPTQSQEEQSIIELIPLVQRTSFVD